MILIYKDKNNNSFKNKLVKVFGNMHAYCCYSYPYILIFKWQNCLLISIISSNECHRKLDQIRAFILIFPGWQSCSSFVLIGDMIK